ncbi:hypothetical protein [Agarivorans litoreus]|uniref:hypothetical protein n=1 Tax=Agarivorans litoreus TaxID=1510455 RepID=UPI001C7D0195|nr:hypothetical protein [Agarivorans litoreus]
MGKRKDAQKALLKKLSQKEQPLRTLHSELFPEEYDFYYDDFVDAKKRSRGVNPMSEEYQHKTNVRRLALGVEPYMGGVRDESSKGLMNSWEYCRLYLSQNKHV